jgi:hypothetical protein
VKLPHLNFDRLEWNDFCREYLLWNEKVRRGEVVHHHADKKPEIVTLLEPGMIVRFPRRLTETIDCLDVYIGSLKFGSQALVVPLSPINKPGCKLEVRLLVDNIFEDGSSHDDPSKQLDDELLSDCLGMVHRDQFSTVLQCWNAQLLETSKIVGTASILWRVPETERFVARCGFAHAWHRKPFPSDYRNRIGPALAEQDVPLWSAYAREQRERFSVLHY